MFIYYKMDYLKDPHTALFVAPTGIGKTYKALRLLETEYKNHFDFIIIICPTLKHNKTYKNWKFLWDDEYIIPIEPKNQLYEIIKTLSNMLAGLKTLFLIDDIIADEKLDKKRQPLLDLAISGRHREHSLWLLTQSYTAIPLNLRRQAKMLYVWRPTRRSDLKTIYDEIDFDDEGDKLIYLKEKLKEGKHICLVIRNEYPIGYEIV